MIDAFEETPPARRAGWSRRPRVVRLAQLLLAACLTVVVAGGAASAHEPTATLVSVSSVGNRLVLDVRVPLDRYDFAYGTTLVETDASDIPTQSLADRVLTAVSITDVDGAQWRMNLGAMDVVDVQGVRNLAAQLTAIPPPGGLPGSVDLAWNLIVDTVASHKVYVVRADDADDILAARTGSDATILGLITAQDRTLSLDDAPGATTTFTSMLSVGFAHFREGPDHLLFLCLVALGAARRRSGWRETGVRLVALSITFTVGHSVSLAAATLGVVELATRWVETGIAVTILLAALHAIRPVLSSQAELAVTGLFGLIHGAGFAGTLADLSVRGNDAVAPLLGFNLGLEGSQLLGLILITAPILVVARSALASVGIAALIGVVAVGWIVERAFGGASVLTRPADYVAGSPERLAMVLAAVAVVVVVVRSAQNAQLADGSVEPEDDDPVHLAA